MQAASHSPVAVGVDGSDQSARALDVAAAEAAYRAAPLRILYAYQPPAMTYAIPMSTAMPTPLDGVGPSDWAQRLLADARARVGHRFPQLDVTATPIDDSASRSLIDASRDASLVVVGCRGRGGFTGLLLGSVSAHVATHAECPVLVVRGEPGTPTNAPIVLGIDVWDLPHAAIIFAFEEAACRHVPLRAVYAGQATPGAVGDTLSPWRDKYPDVVLTTKITDGDAGRVLVAESTTAGMVVVGSHNRGQLRSQLLGSVGYTLIHHGHSPIAIVHATDGSAAERSAS
jgi:nucleotide-binding universal stress UspA family protein